MMMMVNVDDKQTVYLYLHVTHRSSLLIARVSYNALFYSYGYVATATHFGLLTIWETGSFNMRHRCKHNVSILNSCHLEIVYLAAT